MKFKLDVLLMTTLTALSAVAQPNNPAPRLNPQMPQGLTRGTPANEPPPKMPDKNTLSYFIGMNIGRSIKRQDLSVDVDTIAAALRDVLGDKPTRFSDSEYMNIQKELSGAMRAKMMEERKVTQEKMEKEGAENKVKGDEFLAKNLTQPGIKALASGIQYKVIKQGEGVIPGEHDTVEIKYKGSTIDGAVFDHNDKYVTPVTGRTIKGWTDVIQHMKVGSEWQVFIPPDLAYGLRSPTPKIPPNSVLVFDMELLSDAPSSGPHPGAQAAAKSMPISITPGAAPNAASGGPPTPVVSGQIIKVPSAEELKHGAKIEVITNAPSQ